MTPYWLSWFHAGIVGFEWLGPWWMLDISSRGATFAAAAMAHSDEQARALIVTAHDPRLLLVPLEWRFVAQKPPGWTPFCERFPRFAHHQWPFPKEPQERSL